MDNRMETVVSFINWMEGALSSGVEMTDHQRQVIESVVSKSHYNLKNQEDKVNLTEDEMDCFNAALVVFAIAKVTS